MIGKLRRQFIFSATAALLVVLVTLIGIINGAMASVVGIGLNESLARIEGRQTQGHSLLSSKILPVVSPDARNYYTIALDSTYTVGDWDSHSVNTPTRDDIQAIAAAFRIHNPQMTTGTTVHMRVGSAQYAAQLSASGTGFQLTVLDYTEEFSWQMRLLWVSIGIGLLSLLVFLAVISLLSSRAIEPTVRTMENQKRFITNASHELKTPVAIISADAEVLEAVNGENEWTESILNQSRRLNELISALVQLTKASEDERFALCDVDCSSIAKEAADSYRPVIERRGKHLLDDIEPNIHAQAEPKALLEVVNILLDNASKYCDDDGVVTIGLHRQGRRVQLVVANDYAAGEHVDYTRFFERFYRADESHNSSKEGFGIGLAMARELTRRMHGDISASWEQGRIEFIVTVR